LPDQADDALRAVRAHLDDAHAAADRLVQEAQRQAEDAAGEPAPSVPPSGWDAASGDASMPDLRALLALLEALRESVPAELSRQLAAALRELLLAFRALIDWYLERLGEPSAARDSVEVEDIPLD
jgi:regulator of protease activity HflC (stomatin/prohibitin superfamily)